MKVDYFFKEMEGMSTKDAIKYLKAMDRLLNENDEVFKKQEVIEDFQYIEEEDEVAIESIHDSWQNAQELESYYWDNVRDEIDRAFTEHDTEELCRVAEEEAEIIANSITVAMEASDREAAENYVKYGDVLPVTNYNTFTKWYNVFYTIYGVDFFNEWSLNHPEPIELYDEEESDEEID